MQNPESQQAQRAADLPPSTSFERCEDVQSIAYNE